MTDKLASIAFKILGSMVSEKLVIAIIRSLLLKLKEKAGDTSTEIDDLIVNSLIEALDDVYPTADG